MGFKGTRPQDRDKARLAAQLIFNGTTHLETARICQISQATLTNWKNGPDWERYMSEAAEAPAGQVLAIKARARLFQLLDSQDDKIAAKCAIFVLENTDFHPARLVLEAEAEERRRTGLADIEDMDPEEALAHLRSKVSEDE